VYRSDSIKGEEIPVWLSQLRQTGGRLGNLVIWKPAGQMRLQPGVERSGPQEPIKERTSAEGAIGSALQRATPELPTL
jgi:hypothetical protein